ncbi:tyrP-B [Cucurbita argyrosperma subsp. argyrosperma]|nr:tyrP-B [Cucurbita argyrosperma subsp. argyrosperma]
MSITSCLRLPFPAVQSAGRSLDLSQRHVSCLRSTVESLRLRRHSLLRTRLRTISTSFSRRPVESSVSGQEKEIEESEEYELERLFSNLNQATFKREPGSLSSAIFLVAGTTIGAGILAIPAVTQESGFLASAITCTFCWAYMVVTGLLIAEVNVNTMCELGSGGVSLVSMAMRTLGTVGVQLVIHSHSLRPSDCLCRSFFRYLDHFSRHSLMGECNPVLFDIWRHMLLWKPTLLGIDYKDVFNCSQRSIGAINGALVIGIIISFVGLVAVASGGLHWDALLKANFEAVPMSIPIIALSFVYQNVVPVLCTNLEGNLAKVRTSIVIGTAIPLVLFLVWNGVILGTISNLDMGSDKILDPLQQLRSTNGDVGPIVEVFSLLAIATSYIGFVLGLSDFLADLLKLPSGENRPLPFILTLVPPLILSLIDPEIFFKSLDVAGTYGVLLLFGIIPAAMSWSDRYSRSPPSVKLPMVVPGGRFTLSLVIGGAGWVIFSELLENFGHL